MKREAALLRGRIEHRARLVDLRIDVLMLQVRALARKPAALPVAFVCGILAERLFVPGGQRAFGLLAGLAGQLEAVKLASGLVSSPVR